MRCSQRPTSSGTRIALLRGMTIRTFVWALVLGAALSARGDALDARSADAQIELRDVSANGGSVSGAIENHGSLPVKDVTLLVQHHYRWPNEYKPGAANPGSAEKFIVSDTIPPGGRA